MVIPVLQQLQISQQQLAKQTKNLESVIQAREDDTSSLNKRIELLKEQNNALRNQLKESSEVYILVDCINHSKEVELKVGTMLHTMG